MIVRQVTARRRRRSLIGRMNIMFGAEIGGTVGHAVLTQRLCTIVNHEFSRSRWLSQWASIKYNVTFCQFRRVAALKAKLLAGCY